MPAPAQAPTPARAHRDVELLSLIHICLLLLVLGVMSFMRLTLRELPAIDPPIVSVSVDYPGASASVVETRITQTLEDALAGIEGINTIDSSSQNGA